MAGTGGIQVLRFKTRRTLDTHLVRHIAGQRRHPTTRSTATIDGGSGCVDLGGVGLAAARAAVEAHWPTGPGRKPHQALDMVCAGPPPYVIPVRDQDGKVVTDKDENDKFRPLYKPNPGRWSPERELEWATSIEAMLPELVGPESVVASVTLHRDELSPHVQAVVVPIQAGRLGWCRVRDAVAQRLAPQVKDARKKAVARGGEDAPRLSTRTRYGVLQDALYYRVSRQFGLSRGQVGSEATHVEIDRAAAAEAREGQALYEAEQARAAAREAAAAADASRQTRDEIHDQAVANLAAAREARQDKATAERERDTARTKLNQAVGDLAAFNSRGPWVRRVHQERELRHREQAGAERRAELDHKASELTEREVEVAKDAAEVGRRQADLAAREAKLNENQKAVAAERREADETRKAAQAVFRTATRRRKEAEELELKGKDELEDLARREADLATEQEAFEPARRQLAADRRTVEEREAAIRRDEAAVKAREETVQGLEDRETALRSAEGAVRVERERLTAERAAAGRIGAQALWDRREVVAQREEVQRRDRELGDSERRLGAQNRRQEQREEQQVRTADELAAARRALNVEIDRMRRQRERLLARLVRWRNWGAADAFMGASAGQSRERHPAS